jgi:hypothetical protein
MTALSTADPNATEEVEGWLRDTDEYMLHEQVTVIYEHGQHYATCNACGASWGVEDLDGDEPYCLEEIDGGDESCTDHA